jgi:hypothetical protein
MEMDDFKKQLENQLGFEINSYRIVPKYTTRKLREDKIERVISDIDPYGEENWEDVPNEIDQLLGYDIVVEKKKSLEYIENRITILKTGEIMNL